MHVGIISPHAVHPPNSGDRIRTVELIDGLRALGIETTLFVSWFAQGQAPPNADGVVYVRCAPANLFARLVWRARLQLRRRTDPFAIHHFPFAEHAVRSAVEGSSCDVLDFQHSRTSMWSHKPAVLTLHNLDGDRLKHTDGVPERVWKSVNSMEAAAVLHADAVVVFSEDDARRVESFGPSSAPLSVVPIGHQPPKAVRKPSTSGMKTAAFIGSFDYEPNQDAGLYLIDHWPQIQRQSGLETLLLIGRGAARNLPSDPPAGVSIRSDVADVAVEASEADVLVVPLMSGGGVRVKIIEAFAMGLPVVSTRLGIEGLGAEDGVHAIIVDEAEDIGAGLARAADDALRANLAANALQLWHDKYTPQRMAEGMRFAYEAAMKHVANAD